MTAVHIAIERINKNIAKELLKHDPDLSLENKNGYDLLESAEDRRDNGHQFFRQQSQEIVNLLQDKLNN